MFHSCFDVYAILNATTQVATVHVDGSKTAVKSVADGRYICLLRG